MTTFSGVAVRFGVKAEDGLSMSRQAIVDALPRFFKRGAPVHLGHGLVKVGKVISASLTPAALTVKFEVTDDSAASLISTDGFCALSVGFKYNDHDVRNGVLQGCDLNEISLADIPGCPGCHINFPNH